ncbi:alpha/beta hydrolase family protein [Aureispira anguillae]|uniref:Prolyl oligopeptidase family serine peptidase n=1 Tax=Aureispira anguillae TaxID=2864201 RepID=A0A915YHH1_9BACT|nr:prolyl oligopeptidase family serine peptidase [Aureispira anguillae]BDS13140.1 prolyl oligopeptidase family serine peptidase [Aureispira anguillae]
MELTAPNRIEEDNLSYKKPPKEILDLVDVPRAPFVQMDRRGEYMLLIYRDSYQTIAELSAKELRLGGLRVNPITNIGSRTIYYNNLQVKLVKGGTAKTIHGLPTEPRLANFIWSPCQTKLAFTNTTESGVEAWVLDLKEAKADRLTSANVNANLGNPIRWFEDSRALLLRLLPKQRKQLIDTTTVIPAGPTISISDGSKAQNRTYQDLLKNKNDEHNFEALTTSELYKVTLDGEQTQWLEGQAMYRSCLFSPDGKYVQVMTIHPPFSYLVPYTRFPHITQLYTSEGKLVKTINEVPLIEEIPKGFMSVRQGRRMMQWRNDRPASLIWAEALDGGDAGVEVPFRDAIYEWEVPFEQAPRLILQTINRFDTIEWGNDQMAIAHDYWWNNRNTKVYTFNPSDPNQAPKVIFDRNYQDKYNDPGEFVTRKNAFNRLVLDLQEDTVFLVGEGHSEAGQFPFIDQLNLNTQQKERCYQSTYTTKLEAIYFPIALKEGQFIVRIESPTDYPNYYIRNIFEEDSLVQITAFENPFKSIQAVHKEVITYERADGVELSGTLYLPVGYDKEKKEKMPMIVWAYPREFKDNNSAGQVTTNSNEFIYPFYGSMVYWVTRGYVVLDDASFPIVGVGDTEPNDSFRTQLVANAKAAIDAVDNLGYIDRNRVAVGGHSYGAFMTANLLSHCNLFAAGIARSGAYNRTLTPFGFQSEERNYWEAPEVYNAMSPFMHADKMKTPLLLVHGEADNNSGTYPLQSERYFNALKGLGATARLVILPKESHGYSAKESILHLLWEQDCWLEKYLK